MRPFYINPNNFTLETRTMAHRKPESNQAFIKRLAGNNILKEAFIISAIDSYAREIANGAPIEDGLIHSVTWRQCAREILNDLESR
jgi:hypothetical protein